MPQPRQTAAYPTAGERNVYCVWQYATPTPDGSGGRGEPTWTNFGTWRAKVTTLSEFLDETKAVTTFQVEGPYRRDVVDYDTGGTGLRIVTNGMTLKVALVENPQARNRTLVAHCANAENTQ